MARQMLNVEVATVHFREMYNSTNVLGAPALWLLHIDADELFFSSTFYEKNVVGEDGGVDRHFEALNTAGFKQVRLRERVRECGCV